MTVHKRLFTSGSIFLVANVVAGLCHYIFQVLASKQLSAADFASLNSWFAGLALFFMLGSLLQYAAVFFPMDNSRIRKWLIFINILCIGLAFLWLKLDDSSLALKAFLVIVGGCISGWLLGQIQNRLMFYTISAGNIIVGLSKLIIVYFFIFSNPVESYRFALFACYLPGLWLISYQIWAKAPISHSTSIEKKIWLSPIILSVAGAIIPQMDMVLLAKTLSNSDFSVFVKCSLFYKAIYFFIFILAQWLLPHQVRSEAVFKARSIYSLVIAIFTSGILALTSPWIIKVFLNWPIYPSIGLIFLSCLNMSLLTWIFILIQHACVQQKNRLAANLLLGLICEAFLQYFFHLETVGYFLFAIFAQSILVLYSNIRLTK